MRLPVDPGWCACGHRLHYTEPTAQRMVEDLVKQTGENVVVRVGLRRWLVQRHYIALHGLKAADLPLLGFPEIGAEEAIMRGGEIGPTDE